MAMVAPFNYKFEAGVDPVSRCVEIGVALERHADEVRDRVL
jgi:hypothetical protein